MAQQRRLRSLRGQVFEAEEPSIAFEKPHENSVYAMVALKDGSFVSCSEDKTAKRWSIVANNDDNKGELRLVGTYGGHNSGVTCAVEKDDNRTLITSSFEDGLKVWDIVSCECLETIPMESYVVSLLKTKDNSTIVCGLSSGKVQMRKVSDLSIVVPSFEINPYSPIESVCELEDGSFVSASDEGNLKRWNDKGKVLQTFLQAGKPMQLTYRVIELNSDTLVSVSEETVKVWKVSTGKCYRTLTLHKEAVNGLVKLSGSKFATGSMDETIRVWDDKGDCLKVLRLGSFAFVEAMALLADGAIAFGSQSRFEIRKLLKPTDEAGGQEDAAAASGGGAESQSTQSTSEGRRSKRQKRA